jgi:putative ABC transport system permease protein
MFKMALKSLFGRKVRLILTVVSIVLGVGFVAGTFVLTDTMNKAFDELFATASSGSDVVVRAVQAFAPSQAGPSGGGEERDPVPADLLSTVERVSGVASASGEVSGYAQMVDPATGDAIGGFGPPTLGGNWTNTNPAITLRAGEAPTGPDQVVVDAGTASRYDLTVGEDIRILFQGPPSEFTISGIAGFGDADNLGGATLALFDTPTAQRVLDRKDEFDSISVVADDGVDPSTLREHVQTALPPKVEAVTSATVADEQASEVQQGLSFFRIALLVFAFIALFVGAFIIFNTFSIIVAQRARELALLRAIGASSRQVMVSVVVEAVAVGVIASVIGIVAGIGIAVGLKGLLSAFGIDLPSTATQIQPRTIVVSLIVGTVVTTVASIVPARRAARLAPIEALREAQDSSDGGFGRRFIAGLVVTGLGVGGLAYGLFGTPSNAGLLIGAGAAITFVGIAVLSPLASRPLAGTIGAPARGLSTASYLARENAMRNPRRTAATASALMIGLGLIAMVSVLSASLKASFTAALESSLRADLTISTSASTAFSRDVAERVREVDDVDVVSELRQGGFHVNGTDAFLTGVDPATIDQVADIDPSEGAMDALGRGEVLVYTQTLDDNGWSVGDELPSAFATTGSDPLTIGGTFDENGLIGTDYVVSLDTYDDLFTTKLDTLALVKLAPGADVATTTTAAQRATTDFGNIEVQDQASYREQQVGFVDQLLALVTALLLLAVIIALFGVMNTLGLSIFERTRELGLLRAVGMGRRQVKRMIRWESVIIAILGALFGIVIGIAFGWALQQALAPEGVTEFRLPVGQLVFYVVLVALAGVVVAILPARRAAKLNVLQAISYE